MSIDKEIDCSTASAHANGGSRSVGYVLASLAFLTCPCHLPIWLVLFAGSAFGAILSENLVIAGIILIVVFILSGLGAIRRLNKS
jgi:mercuric ion transport protein